ncbi:MAG: sulfur carrier protein ThiS [Chlorobiaceae bacterium]|nr:sulfur carrier protein ThiS [Chlorobiaceae bacterium]
MISIRLNGKTIELPDGSTISDLLSITGADRQQVAVVVNSGIVRPAERAEFMVKENDEVDLLTFAGGG